MLRLFQSLQTVASIRQFSTTTVHNFPKLKTHSGAKKRWTALPNGMFKRAKTMKTHLNSSKSASRLNRLGLTAYATHTQERALRRLMPYR